MHKLIATGKPVVLVLFGGRAQVVSGLAEKCAAVIQAWYPGEEGGNAVADILYGNISPSGKLSVSYPSEEVYGPLCYLYAQEKDPRVAWEFGYGKSYATFTYDNLRINKEASAAAGDGIKLSFDITNNGDIQADEIAQIYLSPGEEGQHIRPIKLQGFARVSLKPGEKKRVEATLYPDQFGYCTNDGSRRWNIDPGKYRVKIGASSQDIRLQDELTLTGSKIAKPIRDRYFSAISVI